MKHWEKKHIAESFGSRSANVTELKENDSVSSLKVLISLLSLSQVVFQVHLSFLSWGFALHGQTGWHQSLGTTFLLAVLWQVCRCWRKCERTRINLGAFAFCIGWEPL